MEKELLPKITKRKVEGLLRDGKRLDGRGAFDTREIQIETGISNKAEGSARVKVGKSDVIVGVKMNAVEPYADSPDEGTLMVSMEFSAMSGERHENGPPKMDSIEIARVVDRGIRESGFIDWKGLCITEKEKVWSIAVDIYCINDDGNALDASAIAAVTALRVARLPVYDEKEQAVNFEEHTDTPIPLTKNIPYSMTFYKIGDHVLVDPTREEEDASDARLTLTLSSSEKEKIIHSMQKGGIISLTKKDLSIILEQSQNVYEAVFPVIDKEIQ
jgi:exosome complex component RRP42